MSTVVEYILGLKDAMSPKIDDATRHVQKMEGALSGVKSSLSQIAPLIGTTFGLAGIAMFGKSVVSAGTIVENAITGLTTLLKSQSEATEVVKNTMEDAEKTPFAFEGLLQANKALISAGIESKKAREDVLNLANAIAATGGTDDALQRMVINLQQISNTGYASSQDIKQFAQSGINIYKVLSEATGKPIAKIKEMGVTYDMLSMALKKAHEAGGIYAGGLENMAKNTSVKISNVGDAIFKKMNEVFIELKPVIDSVLSSTLNIIEKLGTGLINTIQWVKEYKTELKTLGIVIGSIVTWMTLQKIATMTLTAVQTFLISSTTLSTIANIALGRVYDINTKSTGLLTAAQYALNVAMTANPIGLIITAVAALAAGIYYAWQKFEGFRRVVFGVWEILKAFGIGIGHVFKGIGEAIWGVLTFDPAMIIKGLKDTIDAAKDGAKAISEAWEIGKEKGEASLAKSKSLIPGKAGVTGKDGKAAPVVAHKEPKTKAEGQKNINIHISYNAPLIQGFTISTTNIKEGLGNLKEQVTAILTGATHDSLIVADY